MAKTRSQAIKKEEEDHKDAQLLHSVKNTAGNSSKITKRKSSKNKNRRLPDQDVKMEEDTDIKSLLKSTSNYLKLSKKQHVSQEQINQLIDVIVNHNTSILKAARTVKIPYMRAAYYYNQYKNHPEKKIPSPRNGFKFLTQEQIENLIKYINSDKMTITGASAKANMSYSSGKYYYDKYLKDPDHNIPIPKLKRYYTQDQKNKCIGYIINDKMTIKEASKKAKMNASAGRRYYHKYFNVLNSNIATPSHIVSYTYYTQEQIQEVISYIVDDKMTIAAASRKANVSDTAAIKYYRRYLKDNNMEPYTTNYGKRYTQDEINEFIRYIVDDKMTIKAASKKANMAEITAQRYYRQYRIDHNIDVPTRKHTQDKRNELIGYIVADKMTVKAASKKANIARSTGQKYYHQYLEDRNIDVPIPKFMQNKVNALIGYIVDNKMNIKAASKKANMCYASSRKYYRKYLKGKKHDAATHCL